MILRVDDLCVRHGTVQAVQDVSLRLGSGELLALIGLNGAGKSSVLAAIAGLVPVASGMITLDGARIETLPRHRRRAVALVPEGRVLAPSLSVRETLVLGAGPVARAELATRFAQVLARLPMLGGLLDRRAGTLSGGQAQMAAIGRALMAAPRLLLLDEPTLGLSPAAAAEVMTLLATLKTEGQSMILVDQGIGAALLIADHGAVLSGGRVVAEGSADALRSDPKLADVMFA